MARNASTARYWRQVHAVQRMTGTTSAIARRAVALMRDERGYQTAAETARHPIIVTRLVRSMERDLTPEPPADDRTTGRHPYRDLSDWIDSYRDWDGEYDYYEIETNADY